jgi:hypothetical protein
VADTPRFCGNSTALPAIVIRPASGTIVLVVGASPVKNSKNSTNASAEVALST